MLGKISSKAFSTAADGAKAAATQAPKMELFEAAKMDGSHLPRAP